MDIDIDAVKDWHPSQTRWDGRWKTELDFVHKKAIRGKSRTICHALIQLNFSLNGFVQNFIFRKPDAPFFNTDSYAKCLNVWWGIHAVGALLILTTFMIISVQIYVPRPGSRMTEQWAGWQPTVYHNTALSAQQTWPCTSQCLKNAYDPSHWSKLIFCAETQRGRFLNHLHLNYIIACVC